MGLYDRPVTEIVWAQINRDNPQLPYPLNANNVVLLQGPFTNNLGTTQRNTRAIFNGVQGMGYNGKVEVFYDRLKLNSLYNGFTPTITIPYLATTRGAVLNAINAQLGLGIALADIDNPDVSVGASTIKTGSFTFGVNANCLAFTGNFTVKYTREDPALTDIWLPDNDSKVGLWSNTGWVGRVWGKSWQPWQSAMQNLPRQQPLRNTLSGVATFIQVLRNWTGIAFECNSVLTDNEFDLTEAVAQVYATTDVPEANQNYKTVMVLTPIPGRHRWTQPLYFHWLPRDTNEVVTATYSDFYNWFTINNYPIAAKGAKPYGNYGKHLIIDYVGNLMAGDVMYGTPWGGNGAEAINSSLTRMAQHAFPTKADFDLAVANHYLVYGLPMNLAVSSYPSLTRNGYTSGPRGGSSDGASFSKFIYVDATTGKMKYNSSYNGNAGQYWLP